MIQRLQAREVAAEARRRLAGASGKWERHGVLGCGL
jgi:hypothetical protein